MSFKVDRAEVDLARVEVIKSLHDWRDRQTDTAKLFDDLLAWVGLEIAAAIQDRDEKGAWK